MDTNLCSQAHENGPTYKSILIWKFYPILFYHLKKSLYQLYHIILQYTKHLNFCFIIQHIKIIYPYNKIIYPHTISILSHLFPLSNFCLSSTETTYYLLPPPPPWTNPKGLLKLKQTTLASQPITHHRQNKTHKWPTKPSKNKPTPIQ